MRLQTVDVMRGVASLAVAMFHMGLVGYGWIGVPIFFVVSGFIIPFAMYKGGYTLTDWPKYMSKRILRIEPPYLVAVAMALVLAYLSSITPGYQGKGFNVTGIDVMLHLGYLVDFMDHAWLNPVFWTLSLEFQYYLFISLFFAMLVSPNRNIRAVFMLGCLALGLTFAGIRPVLFPWLGLFCIGIVTFQYHMKLICKWEMALYFLLNALVLVAVTPTEENFSTIIVPVVGIFSGLIIGFVSYRGNRVFLFFGAISYSLYLIHVPIGGRLINLGQRFIADSELEHFLLSLFALSISILFAWCFYRFVEKPAIVMSSRIRYRKEKTAPKISS